MVAVESTTATNCSSSSLGTPTAKSLFESRASSPPAHAEDTEYPDGGSSAWLTVFGTVLALFCCGQLTAFGAFQTWYAANQLHDLPASTISWIGSLQLWLLYFSGGILGRIFDAYGPRVILIPGSALLVFSTMIMSVCKKYYQFLLVQGLLTGLSYGMLRIPPGQRKSTILLDASVVRDTPFILLITGCLLINFGLFIPFVYLADYSIYRGVSSGTSFYIISAMNAGSIFGRIAPSFLADYIGRFNIAIPSTLLMGVLALCFWMFARSLVAIIFFAILYGCFSGAFLAMQIPCIAQISKIEEVGTRIGILYSVASFG
ncbi:hypothetical protein BN946_scf184970.g137 [Trametes cinnabarina]|uniref:Major facilitator superfamily (MFS) profile domain-containing protein n=1 Tax=Pycnoporus cinnabarinus TaxID=5643 RepID=A0A060SD75_PYCCI|nr:hypothetical protein BN946_scf184970.g137 [Trametes cinnabarina]